MAASNRAKLISKLHTELKKRYTLPPSQPSRPLLEHILYACLLQDAPADLADEGLAKCEQEFFDWNEVRVTTVTELTQVLAAMPDPPKTARRLKEVLQAVFEEFYAFDLDHLKKENLGKAVAKFEAMEPVTPFVLSYTVQHGLGGHSIPVDYSAMVIMLATEIATQSEAAAGKVPGLERAVPKNKAIEFSNLLHQAGVALMQNAKDKKVRQLLDAVSKGSSDRYDQWEASKKAAIRRVKKRRRDEKLAAEAEELAAEATKKAESKPTKQAKKTAASAEQPASAGKPAAKKATKKAASASPKSEAKKPAAATKKAATKKTVAKKTAVKETSTKKATTKKSAAKKSTSSKSTKKSTAKKTPKSTTKTSKSTKKKASKKAATKNSASKSTGTKKSTNRKLSKRKPR